MFINHRRPPIKARVRPKRDDRRLHANPRPRREQFTLTLPRLRHLDRPSPRDYSGPVSTLYNSRGFTFAAFLAMFGKQWVNRYLRNRGGSAADKSRDRQRKLDGFEKRYFHLIIESLPVMLQLALLLLGCTLSQAASVKSIERCGVVVGV